MEKTTYSSNFILSYRTSQPSDENDADLFQGVIKRPQQFFQENYNIGNETISVPKIHITPTAPNSQESQNAKFNFKSLNKFRQGIRAFSTLKQSWKGVVLEICGDEFEAKLQDLSNPGTYEVATLSTEDICKEDLELFSRGAVFYMAIGRTIENGTQQNVHTLRFQRLPAWTSVEIDKAADWADDIDKSIKWE